MWICIFVKESWFLRTYIIQVGKRKIRPSHSVYCKVNNKDIRCHQRWWNCFNSADALNFYAIEHYLWCRKLILIHLVESMKTFLVNCVINCVIWSPNKWMCFESPLPVNQNISNTGLKWYKVYVNKMIRFHFHMCKIDYHSIVVNCSKLFDIIFSCTKRRGSECSTLVHSPDKQFDEGEVSYCQSRQKISMR